MRKSNLIVTLLLTPVALAFIGCPGGGEELADARYLQARLDTCQKQVALYEQATAMQNEGEGSATPEKTGADSVEPKTDPLPIMMPSDCSSLSDADKERLLRKVKFYSLPGDFDFEVLENKCQKAALDILFDRINRGDSEDIESSLEVIPEIETLEDLEAF